MEKVITNNDSQYVTKEDEQAPLAPIVEDPNPTPANFFTRVKALIALMRPKQWTKNGAVFIGLVFASQLFQFYPLIRAIVAFITFCFVSSTIYVLNDLLDIEKDRLHPTKRFRPLASGTLPTAWAKVALIGLLGICCLLTATLFLIPSPPDIYKSLGERTSCLPSAFLLIWL
ncbi:UbiA family prenyltransferase [Dictyobacter kobayashii]|uniref:Decaprenyl-phosphate phosphoribosyltransferase n=1 Tax=Dictyobacter kobayashii TaxID=2014872 RepID=A0A402ALP9_9CHLR|nr:UbiA family prenyltransferase [Dictyobacter kobayashii]GCE20033.1 hypothetical protein KDK_38330 [Dictyobacter kobayashii]